MTSGFSNPAPASAVTTVRSVAAPSTAMPSVCGAARSPYWSCSRAGRREPAPSRRSVPATRRGPGKGPAASACSAPAAPSLARKVSAVTTVAAASNRSRSATANAALPMVSAFDDISASPSPWSSASGGNVSASRASGATSPVPRELNRPMVGIRSWFSRSTSASAVAGPRPLRPTAICSMRTAVIALTCSAGSAGPAVVAWLRSRPSPCAASSCAALSDAGIS